MMKKADGNGLMAAH
ncbi:hypothetical protein H4Q32_022370 [Labeo rohita]|uniref:Uncharacterized protein n=1 Tax=Labeo rohita TaxID=84645 RepID=A0ABQ8MAD1_LABRO|nr:hypothetical protein H4Q32_022370 [Labeo rohita]